MQLYIHDNDTSEILPKEQLQGFTRISLKPGETKDSQLLTSGRAACVLEFGQA